MRTANTYRGAKRNEARGLKLPWRRLILVQDSSGTRRVKYPFEVTGQKKDNADGK